jgi:hypothetical protein
LGVAIKTLYILATVGVAIKTPQINLVSVDQTKEDQSIERIISPHVQFGNQVDWH